MTAGDGKPCVRCGGNEWYRDGRCKRCSCESGRRYRQENQDKRAESKRRYRQENREKVAQYNRQWQQANPDKHTERSRRYRQANSDKVTESKRRWQQDNPEKNTAKQNRRRARQAESGGSYTAEEFKAMCNHYGNKCLRCNRTGVKLTADHIKPVSKGGTSNIDNIQPLCISCNSGKCDRHIDYRPDAGPLRWLQAKLFG